MTVREREAPVVREVRVKRLGISGPPNGTVSLWENQGETEGFDLGRRLTECLKEVVLKKYPPERDKILEKARAEAGSPKRGRPRSSREKKQTMGEAEKRAKRKLGEMIGKGFLSVLVDFLPREDGEDPREEEVGIFAKDLGDFFASQFQGEVGLDERVSQIGEELTRIGRDDIALLWKFWRIRRGFVSSDEQVIGSSRKKLEEFSKTYTDRIPEEGMLRVLYSHISHLYPDPQAKKNRGH